MSAFPYAHVLLFLADDGDGEQHRVRVHVRDVTPTVSTVDPLIQRLQLGDQAALAEIVRVHTVALTRFARVLIADNATADDVVQDVLVALWDRREALDLRGSLRTYLLGAVRHRVLNLARAERSQRRLFDGIRLASVHDAQNDVLRQIDADDVLATVERALAPAPPQCRLIFLLNWRAELSYAEIAEQLGISLRTVYNQMYRATKLVASALAAERTS